MSSKDYKFCSICAYKLISRQFFIRCLGPVQDSGHHLQLNVFLSDTTRKRQSQQQQQQQQQQWLGILIDTRCVPFGVSFEQQVDKHTLSLPPPSAWSPPVYL
ncbi:hypothetical protein ACLKA6_013579 [Drosophila palustris]